MTSKTSLPIARLRSLGCTVGHVLGHYIPVTPRIPAEWRYGITLPKGMQVPVDSRTRNGRASAYIARDGRVIVEARQETTRAGLGLPGAEGLTATEAKSARSEAASDVAGLLNSIADTLSKAGRS